MSSQQTKAIPSEPRQRALLVLLGDDDPAISRKIRETLMQDGEHTLSWLPLHRLHEDPIIRRRVSQVIQELNALRTDANFLSFVHNHGESFDLESAVWLFVASRYPEVSICGYQALLDQWAQEIREDWANRLQEDMFAGAELLDAIHRHLFGRLGFRGNESEYFDPENSFVNRVIDRRLGNPIALCLIYLFITQRLEIPVRGVGMPGHFLCRYQTSREEYYIDVFHGGRLLSRQDCIRRLKQFAMEYDDGALQPISPRRTIQRMIANLHLIYKERRDRGEVERLQRYLVALAR